MSNFKNKYTDSEKKIVEDWLDINSIENVKEVIPDNTAFHDTKVILKSGRAITIEVKTEEAYWYKRTGNIGLDFLSAFNFNKTSLNICKKNNNWIPIGENKKFLENITVRKYGKLFTCDADMQLFNVTSEDKYILLKAYDNICLKEEEFINYLKNNYKLRINNKPKYGIYEDWQSAAYFVNPLKDKRLKKCEANLLFK